MSRMIQDDLELWQIEMLERAYQLRIWPNDEELSYLGLSIDEALVRFIPMKQVFQRLTYGRDGTTIAIRCLRYRCRLLLRSRTTHVGRECVKMDK